MLSRKVLIAVLYLSTAHAFRHYVYRSWSRSSTFRFADTGSDGNDAVGIDATEVEKLEGKEIEDALKAMGPSWAGGKVTEADADTLKAINEAQQARISEEIFRKYPYEDIQLPLLPDCNNYYSGQFEDKFWHQNADQVYVFIPIEESTKKSNINVQFKAKGVKVDIDGKELLQFDCLEKIIPEGSFWIIEEDSTTGQRYLQLDLEKRFRMINWKNLFGEATPEGKEEVSSREQMLQQLFAANKGMQKLTGNPAESMQQMLANEELMKMVNSPIETTAEEVEVGDAYTEAMKQATDTNVQTSAARGKILDVDDNDEQFEDDLGDDFFEVDEEEEGETDSPSIVDFVDAEVVDSATDA